jgi:hypothetical protein
MAQHSYRIPFVGCTVQPTPVIAPSAWFGITNELTTIATAATGEVTR